MLYTIAIQNLRLQVSVPDSTDTAALDKVIREFNEHLVTFNNGRPVELYEAKRSNCLSLRLCHSSSECKKPRNNVLHRLKHLCPLMKK